MCTASAQRLRRWSNIVQMVYKCFVYAGLQPLINCHLYFISGALMLVPGAIACHAVAHRLILRLGIQKCLPRPSVNVEYFRKHTCLCEKEFSDSSDLSGFNLAFIYTPHPLTAKLFNCNIHSLEIVSR